MNGDMNSTNMNNNTGVTPVMPGVVSGGTVRQQAPTTSSTPASTGGGTSSEGGTQIVCDKCGEYYNSKQRYCMKCGALNYGHPSNQSMKQYINYDVVNHSYVENYDGKLSHSTVEDPFVKKKRASLIASVIFSILPYLPIVLILFLLSSELSTQLTSYSTSIITSMCISVAISILYNYAMCLIYLRANENWWAHFIPFYNNFIYYKITLDSGWFMILSWVPIIGWPFLKLYSLFKLGSRFNRSGLLTMFFPIIMIPVIGLSDNIYAGSLRSMHMSLGATDVDAKGRTSTEREYHTKKIFITLGVVTVSIVVLVIAFPYIMKYAPYVIEFFVKKYHEFMDVIQKMN